MVAKATEDIMNGRHSSLSLKTRDDLAVAIYYLLCGRNSTVCSTSQGITTLLLRLLRNSMRQEQPLAELHVLLSLSFSEADSTSLTRICIELP
jgi:hypothetical protein